MNVDKITKQIDKRIVGLEDRKFSNPSLSIQNKGRLNALSDLKNWIIEQEQHSTWIKVRGPKEEASKTESEFNNYPFLEHSEKELFSQAKRFATESEIVNGEHLILQFKLDSLKDLVGTSIPYSNLELSTALRNSIISIKVQGNQFPTQPTPQTSEQPLAEQMSELTESMSPTFNQVLFDIKERAKKSSRLLYISQSLSEAVRELLIEDGFKLSQFESSGTSIRW